MAVTSPAVSFGNSSLASFQMMSSRLSPFFWVLTGPWSIQLYKYHCTHHHYWNQELFVLLGKGSRAASMEHQLSTEVPKGASGE